MEECAPKDQMKKQVWFNMEEDLSSDPTLPTELTTFLAGVTAKEWDNDPSPSIPLSMDPPQLPPTVATSTIPSTWKELI